MFTYDDLRGLLSAVPFVPFRLYLSEGNFIEVDIANSLFPAAAMLLLVWWTQLLPTRLTIGMPSSFTCT
jgi:hypothetical protein